LDEPYLHSAYSSLGADGRNFFLTMKYKTSFMFLLMASLLTGCSAPPEGRFEYPDTDDVELRLTASDVHVTIEGDRFFTNRESTLLVKVLDKDFSEAQDAKLECLMHNRGRRSATESIDQFEPGNFRIVLKPTWVGKGTVILTVSEKNTEAIFKLEVTVNE
jgi:hypothetical protein